ncbi:hypothetical protein KEM52_002383, partial [Ascosphaera acerosa]
MSAHHFSFPSSASSAGQISTTSILNALHTSYTASHPHSLDPTTSIVVNTWLTLAATNDAAAAASNSNGNRNGTGNGNGSGGGSDARGGNEAANGNMSSAPSGLGACVDSQLARRAWEHARRRAEDGCILLCSSHESSPSLFTPFLQTVPLATPSIAYTALAALRPFLHHCTPLNPSRAAYAAFSAAYTFTLQGRVTELKLALSTSGLDTTSALLHVPAERGARAFDVFYYLLTSSSTPAEREFLSLNAPSTYCLLNSSQTYDPPAYLPTADDAAAAEDWRAALRDIGIRGSAQRSLIAVLAALLKLGNAASFLVDQEDLEDICEDVGGLLNLDPEIILHKCGTDDRLLLVAGLYEAVIDWVLEKANAAIATELSRQRGEEENRENSETGETGTGAAIVADTVGLTVIDVPDIALGKALALRGVFDDTYGINDEMRADGVDVPAPPSSVLRDMQVALAAVERHIGPRGSSTRATTDAERDKVTAAVEKVAVELDAESSPFLYSLL